MKRRCCIVNKQSGKIVFSSNKSWIVESMFDHFGSALYMVLWQTIPI